MRTSWRAFISRLIDDERTSAFIHPRLRDDPLTMARAKVQLFGAVATFLIIPIAAQPYFSMGHYQLGLMTLGFGVMFTSVIPIIRYLGSLWLTTHVVSLALYGSLVTGIMVAGGLNGFPTKWLVCVPMFAFSFGGMATGLLWAGVVLVSYVGLWFAINERLLRPVQIFPADQLSMVEVSNFVIFLFTVCLFVLIVDAINQWLVSRVRAEELALQETNQALELARDEALLASRAKSRFLANMSHELRTPLNAIIGYSEIIEEELHDQELDGFDKELSAIQSAGRDLTEIIQDILDLTRIESSKLTLEPDRFRFDTFLDELRATASFLARTNQNELLVECDAGWLDLMLETDRHKLRRILINLLSNAAKFTHRGTITLRLHPFDAARDEVLCVSVEDTGIGIDVADQARIWEAFVQVDDSSTRQNGGLGLGLSLVHDFAELLGIAITLHSRPQQGTTFELALPTSLIA